MNTKEYSIDPTIANPRWANAQRTLIDINVYFAQHKMILPYTAAKINPESTISEEIFARAAAEEFGPVAEYAPVTSSDSTIIVEIPKEAKEVFDNFITWYNSNAKSITN